MRFVAVLVLAAAFSPHSAAPAIAASAAASSREVNVKVLAFNDFHGSLLSSGTFAEGPGAPSVTVGGVDYLAAYVAQRASLNPNHAVVSAGDLTGASPLLSAASNDEVAIEAMNLLGLDFNSVGNHELDSGLKELQRKQDGGCIPAATDSCITGKPFAGAAFKYLAANILEKTTGKRVFPPYAVKTFDGVKIAFIGTVLKGTADIVTPSGAAGLTFTDEADAINGLIPELRRQGINAIVVLVHQGGRQVAADRAITAINDCAGMLGKPGDSEILNVVARLDDAVDLVISAHSHTAYNCRLPNAKGRTVPVTQAASFGRLLTDIDLHLDRRTGRVTDVAALNILVSQPDADAASSPVHPFLEAENVVRIRQLIADNKTAVAPIAGRVIGTIAEPLIATDADNGERPAGNLVADAQLGVTAASGAVISFVNGSGVRAPGFNTEGATYPHDVTYQEAFTVRPFGNRLQTITMTAEAVKEVLEQQFTGCNGQTRLHTLQVSKGFHFEWSASGPACAKVRHVSLTMPDGVTDHIVVEGVVQHPAKTYRITVDDFLASGKDNFTAFLKGKDPKEGPLDIEAVATYMSATYKAPQKPYDPKDPALGLPRAVKLP